MGLEYLDPDPTLLPGLSVLPFDWLDRRPYRASLVCVAGEASSSESKKFVASLSLLLARPEYAPARR